MTWLHIFWAVFYSSRRPNQIGPTADFDGADISTPYIFHGWMANLQMWNNSHEILWNSNFLGLQPFISGKNK